MRCKVFFANCGFQVAEGLEVVSVESRIGPTGNN